MPSLEAGPFDKACESPTPLPASDPDGVPMPPTPGASVAPVLRFTLPWIVPMPPSVAPLVTLTALLLPVEPVTSSVPPLTVVAPE